ncbi:MAG TPA: hypothetical protein VGS79_11535 [Puia sp.]|nr:hypothetical protein [Puia sp.]
MAPIKLSDLSISDFRKVDAWKVIESSYEEEELRLVPADKNERGNLLRKNGEVWCLTKATFSNGAVHDAVCMSRADAAEVPLSRSVWNGEKYVPLFVPPAPGFVLKTHGPKPFSKEFNERLENVFPIDFEIVPRFETAPAIRRIVIGVKGAV